MEFNERSTRLEIDRIATQFENEWNTDQELLVGESHLNTSQAPRAQLLKELLSVEIELRQTNDVVPNRLEYDARFPQDRDVIEEVFKATLFNGNAMTRTEFLESAAPTDKDTIASKRNELTRRMDGSKSLPESPQYPERIGEFQLLKKMGRGGMGEVYLAHQESLDRNVALKLITQNRSDSKKHIERFEIEAKAAASLDHANIIRVLDYGRADNRWFIAMPVIEGGTLADLIAQQADKPRLETRNATLRVIATVAEALDYAHKKDIVHRDIKPQNILLDQLRNPIIADFGLAKMLNQDGLTKTTDLMGSPMYLSPEQAKNSRDVGPATDIHALGVIIYQLLSNAFPFKSDTTAGVIKRVIDDVPSSPRDHNPDTPLDLETIVMKCLEKNPEDRYSGAQLAADLHHFLKGEPIEARRTALPVRLYRWAKRKPMESGLFSALAFSLIAAGFAAFFLWKSYQAESMTALATQEKLDIEVKAKQQEIDLKEAAILARKKAELATERAKDSARFAQAQQARAAGQAIGFAYKFGDYTAVERAIDGSFPMNLRSFDTRYFESFAEQEELARSHFVTSDWGLYDSRLDPAKKRVATVDRAGRVDVWDVETGKRLAKLSNGLWHPVANRHLARWLILDGKLNINGELPGFYSSIEWETETTLLATTIKGELCRLDLASNESDVVWSSDAPLHFVRYNSDRSQLLVADSQGNLTTLDEKFETVRQANLGAKISFLEYSEPTRQWLAGAFNGKLWALKKSLETEYESQFSGVINDARIVKDASDYMLLIAAGQEPVSQFKILNMDKEPTLKLFQQFEMPNRRPGTLSCQVTVDMENGRLFGLDSKNDVHVWRLASGTHIRSYSIGAKVEIRQPNSEMDGLEKRNGARLRWVGKNLLHTNRIGDMKLAEEYSEEESSRWQTLSVKLGPSPELAADSEIPGHIWAMDNEGTLSLVDFANDTIIARVSNAHAGGRQAIVVLENRDVATVGNDGWVKLWRFADGKIREVRRIESEFPLVSLAIHEERDLVAAVDANSKIQIWKLSDGKHVTTIRFPSLPSDKATLEAALKSHPINSGKIAFSMSGKYLAAYGAGQAFATFTVDDFQLAKLGTQRISGNGGTALLFSSVVENRILTSDDISVSCNFVELGDSNEPSNFQLLLPGWLGARDFTPTHDGLRIVSLGENGEIRMCTTEHMVSISNIVCPTDQGASIAMAATDAAITVANQDGSLIWCPLGNWQDAKTTSKISQGIVHWLQRAEGEFPCRPGDYNFESSPANHLVQPVLLGSTGDLGDNNRLHLLEKKNSKWELNEVRFQGDDTGACSRAKLFYSPSGKRVLAIRQLQPAIGDYSGRLILLYEQASGEWKSDVVIPKGNAGFWPMIRFDKDENVDQVFCGDYGSYQLLRLSRQNGAWKTESVWGNRGISIRGQFDPQGKPHFLTSRWAGRSNGAPGFYASEDDRGELSFLPVRGNFLLMDSKGKKFAFSQQTQAIVSSSNGVDWDEKTMFSHFARKNSAVPTIDNEGRIWFAESLGDRIVYQSLTEGKWSTGILRLDQNVPRGCVCHPRPTAEGTLEVMVYQPGNEGFLAVVESFEPVVEKAD